MSDDMQRMEETIELFEQADAADDAATAALPDVHAEEAASLASAALPVAAAPPVAAASPAEETAPLPRPRTRWAAIVWGLVLAALAAAAAWFVSDARRLDDLALWVQNLEVGAVVAYVLLALGALILVIGLVGLLRRAQLAALARRG